MPPSVKSQPLQLWPVKVTASAAVASERHSMTSSLNKPAIYQVLQPYYKSMESHAIDSMSAVNDLIARYAQDSEVLNVLRARSSSLSDLNSLLEKDNADVVNSFVALELFHLALARPLAMALLRDCKDSAALLGELPELERISLKSFDPDTLALGFSMLLSQSYGCTVSLPSGTTENVLDMDCDAITELMMSRSTFKKYTAMVSSPAMLKSTLTSEFIASHAQKVTVRKGVIAPSRSLIYFDAQGQAWANRIPQGAASNDFYLAETLAEHLATGKSQMVKLTLNDMVAAQLNLSQTHKVLRRQYHTVALTIPKSLDKYQGPQNFSTDSVFDVCDSLLQVLTSFKERNRNFKHISVQFESALPAALVLIIHS